MKLNTDFFKILPVGVELLHEDGRTNIAKLIVAFRSFANASKNGMKITDFHYFTRNL
jgi:hypothetical protein